MCFALKSLLVAILILHIEGSQHVSGNSPIIEGSIACPVKEGYSGVGVSRCDYSIFDEDGIFDGTNILQNYYTDIFRFYIDEDTVNEKSRKLILECLQPLDFIAKTRYYFDIKAIDSAGHEGESFRVTISVVDVPNQPPIWLKIFSTHTFIEHTIQRFEIKATDGDTQINENIIYEITELDSIFHNIITVESSKDGAVVLVGDIDRDRNPYFDTKNTIPFRLVATEEYSRDYVDQNVLFVIVDVDDNAPEISLDPKSLDVCEHSIELSEYSLWINDVDEGLSGNYNVHLETTPTWINGAFNVEPKFGYGKQEFRILMLNSSLLDYESIQEVSINIIATSENGEYESNEKLQVNLINWNDEKPQFSEDHYEVSVLETVEGNHEILRLQVHDNDGDFPITFELTSMQDFFYIDNGVIYTNGSVFDYEILTELSLNISAIDSFPENANGCETQINIAFTTVTISVIDVNDEPPKLDVEVGEIFLEEKRPDGWIIDLHGGRMNASDADLNQDLEVHILWDISTAWKNGVLADNSWKGCFEIEQTPSGIGSYNLELYIVENKPGKTPDYEHFDTVTLRIIAIDWNTQHGYDSVDDVIKINIIPAL